MQATGAQLTPEELEKVDKLAGWCVGGQGLSACPAWLCFLYTLS